MQLENKVAVVTGSGSGIGKAIALAFAREGAAVVVDYASHPEPARDTVEEIESIGGKAVSVQADVTDPENVRTRIQTSVQEFGRLDILVNNASVEHKMPFLQTPLEVWNKVIAINLTGPWLGCREAAEQMVSQNSPGRIINISSVHEDLPMPTNSPYCAAKGGLRMLTRTIAVELAPMHHRQQHRPRCGRDADGCPARGAPRPDGEAPLGDTAGADGQARGDSASGRVPRLRRLHLRDREHLLHRRRHDPPGREPVDRSRELLGKRRIEVGVVFVRLENSL
jgi:NADP-dependent 3-hydroxy acid dehydrogenase YdfG